MPPKAKAKSTPKGAPKGKAKAKSSLVKKQSVVSAVDKTGQVFKGFFIWSDVAPGVKEDPDMLFAKCSVLPGSTNEMLYCKQVDPPGDDGDFEVPQANAFNCNSTLDPMAFHDIGNIPHTNVACVLDFIKQRYVQGAIYTSADPLLVAMNPFKDVGLAGPHIIQKYRDEIDVTKLPPHVYATARVALDNLHQVKKSQTIIVSGESGAGKTEATKMAMRFFASNKSGNIDTRIQTAVMAANPVLEAFGNAKTIRNNNSSRFGRFMQLQVASGGGIEYGSVRNFLLEKSRVITQGSTERSYHIFYFLLKGANAEQQKKYRLLGPTKYNYINPHCLDVENMDDVAEFKDVDESFDSMLMTAEMKNSIYSLVSGVMLLGNVEIDSQEKEGTDAGVIRDSCRKDFVSACELMFLDPVKTEEALTIKISFAGGKEIRAFWSQEDVQMLKSSLAKGVYDKLFDWIIVKLNTNIEPPNKFSHFMGMLDIFGFEVFANNSLEQLFINVTNEMLQLNFTEVVFDKEQKLYRAEGIPISDLVYTSNKEVIDALTSTNARVPSVFGVLEDQCLAPGGNDEKFLSAVYSQLKDNPKIIKPKVNSNVNFNILHTIGEIQYKVTGFLFKNKDVLRPDLIEVLQGSENLVTKGLFEGVVVERGKLAKGQLIGSQFLKQLESMMSLINATEPHFIRCVKPNEEKVALKFTASKVLIQLHSLSILEALQLKNLGYSYRRTFEEFLQQFKFVYRPKNEKVGTPKDHAHELIDAAKVTEGYRIGNTMVFMKRNTAKQIAQKQREALAAWEPLVRIIEPMVMKQKLRRRYKTLSPSVIRLQAISRKRNAKKTIEAPPFSQLTAVM